MVQQAIYTQTCFASRLPRRSNTYGGRAAATTRATSQALGSVFAVSICPLGLSSPGVAVGVVMA
eukprot:354390-Chlamydomonas_euryale.AAC.5